MLNVRTLCVVVDSLISSAKVYDCVIFAWCRQVCDRVVELRFRQNILCQPLINIVSSVFSLADCRLLEKQLSTQQKLDLGLISAGSNGIAP